MIASRITSKAQTTIPRAVRAALGVGPGDTLAYEITDDGVILRRMEDESDLDFVADFSTFTEWADELDAIYDRD